MILILIFISIIALALNFILFLSIIILERKIRIKRLNSNLRYFSPQKLERRVAGYEERFSELDKIQSINRKAKTLIRVNYNRILHNMENLEKYTAPLQVFHFLKFHALFKDNILQVKEYEKQYLDVRFNLFDLTSDIEIEKTVINNLKENTKKIRESIFNSPIKQINSSELLNLKLEKIMSGIRKIEISMENEKTHLSKKFIKSSTQVHNYIQNTFDDIQFMNVGYKFMLDKLNPFLSEIYKIYNENTNNLISIKEKFKDNVSKITEIKKIISYSLKNIEKKEFFISTQDLTKIVSELNILVKENFYFIDFNKKYDFLSLDIFKFIESNQNIFINEIKHHNLPNEKIRFDNIDNAFISLRIVSSKYEKEKISNYSYNSPQYLANLLNKVINQYILYKNVVIQNIADIANINKDNNDFNLLLSNINTMLLQIEFNIKDLPLKVKSNYNDKKEILYEQFVNIRDNSRKLNNELKNELINKINSLNNNLIKLIDETKGASFKFYIGKEVSLFLNRYRGLNSHLDSSINNFEKLYKEEKIDEFLNKTYDLVEAYGIKDK